MGCRAPALVVVALLELGGCASAESDDDAATPSGTLISSPSQATAPLPEKVQEPLERALVSWRERYEVPGAAVMVPTPDGIWSTQRGVTDLESQEPLEPDVVWPLRSVTESVVDTVLLRLINVTSGGLHALVVVRPDVGGESLAAVHA